MRGFMRTNRKGEKGFTLVELLIVFTLLGVLAAIMIPNIAGVVGYGHSQAAAAEKSVVQTAMDAMMAKEGVSSVPWVLTVTKNMASFPDAVHPLYPDYLRTANTTGSYACDTTGMVTQNATGY
jgi:prepilin-type N-terminal cleavage/methylation domain-containing protein